MKVDRRRQLHVVRVVFVDVVNNDDDAFGVGCFSDISTT